MFRGIFKLINELCISLVSFADLLLITVNSEAPKGLPFSISVYRALTKGKSLVRKCQWFLAISQANQVEFSGILLVYPWTHPNSQVAFGPPIPQVCIEHVCCHPPAEWQSHTHPVLMEGHGLPLACHSDAIIQPSTGVNWNEIPAETMHWPGEYVRHLSIKWEVVI